MITNNKYNPFKMWGSYVIFFIIIAIIVLTFINMHLACNNSSFTDAFFQQINIAGPNCYGPTFNLSQILSAPILMPALLISLSLGEKAAGLALIISLILYSVIGFLIGWGIHTLFRKLKNKD